MSDVDTANRVLPTDPFVRAYCDAADVMAWIKDLDGRYIGVSQAWCAILDRSREDIVGRRDGDLFDKDGAADFRRIDEETVGRNTPFETELTLTRADGKRTFSVTAMPIHDGQGVLVACGAVAADITAAGRYTAALEDLLRIGNRLEASFKTTIKDILDLGRRFFDLPVGLVGRIDGDRYVVEHVSARQEDAATAGARPTLDETFCAAVIRANKVVALHDTALAPAEICPKRDWMSQKTYLGAPIPIGGTIHGTIVFSAPERRRHPFNDDERTFARLLGQWLAFFIDRHDRSDAFARSRSELQLIFDHVPVRIIHKNADNVVLRANRAMAESTGYRAEDMIGMRVDDIFDISLDELMAHDRIVLESGKPLLGTIRQTSPRKGRRGWERIDKIPYDDPLSGERTLLAVFSDITELIEKEQALERANEDLRQFAHVASHDLQEPFRKIRTFADILREALKGGEPADIDYALTVMSDSARRGSELVADLLDYAWIDRDRDRVSRIELAATVDEVLSDLWLAANDADARIERRVAAIELDVVPSHIRQILQNFISNAIKFRDPDRPPEIVIAAATDADDGAVRLRVSDNGIGFDPAHGERIFEPFGRLHSKSDYPGSGIGLAVCARLAARNGWKLTAEAHRNAGATFAVTIPAKFVRKGPKTG